MEGNQAFQAITILIGNLQSQISAIDNKVWWLVTFIIGNLVVTVGILAKTVMNRKKNNAN